VASVVAEVLATNLAVILVSVPAEAAPMNLAEMLVSLLAALLRRKGFGCPPVEVDGAMGAKCPGFW
jgi:hypothetical protein